MVQLELNLGKPRVEQCPVCERDTLFLMERTGRTTFYYGKTVELPRHLALLYCTNCACEPTDKKAAVKIDKAASSYYDKEYYQALWASKNNHD